MEKPCVLINDAFVVGELFGVKLPVSAVNSIRPDQVTIVVANNPSFLLKILALNVPNFTERVLSYCHIEYYLPCAAAPRRY